MDDDLTFGASVWATPEPEAASAPPLPAPSEFKHKPAPLALEDDSDGAPFNDFDDFGPTAEPAGFDSKDDDFGDFEDFEEAADIAPESGFQDAAGFYDEPSSIAGPSTWKPLQVDAVSLYADLQDEVFDILDPIWAAEDISRVTTDDPMREVEGVSQILVTSSR